MGLFSKKKKEVEPEPELSAEDIWDGLKKSSGFKDSNEVDITQIQADFKRDLVRPGVTAGMPLEEQWSCQLGYFVARGVSVSEAMFIIMENELG